MQVKNMLSFVQEMPLEPAKQQMAEQPHLPLEMCEKELDVASGLMELLCIDLEAGEEERKAHKDHAACSVSRTGEEDLTKMHK